MPDKQRLTELADRTEAYLTDKLLPFWLDNAADPEGGGYLTYFDRDGKRTGETDKTLLMQIRTLFTMSSAHRAGYGGGRCAELAKMGADFILDNYWDEANEGWVWIADRAGKPIFTGKIGYGHCFAIYAFSEYFLATGDGRGREAAERTYATVMKHMADTQHGGYFQIMEPDWQPSPGPRSGGNRKSMDVHMHMMEGLTTFYEMTGHPSHLRRLLQVIDLIVGRMLHPVQRTGYIQYAPDFTPLPAILFDVEWGRDAAPEDGQARPLDYTSYAHNVEFAWLLLHAADVMGVGRETYADVAGANFAHCVTYGIDREFGGVFVEGPHHGPPTVTEKQFWQQAEVLVGMLDAVALLGDEKYWEAFENVYNFVFDKFVNMPAGGEWYERLDRRGNPIDDALGHAWKINYHTVRSVIQTVRRLRALAGSPNS